MPIQTIEPRRLYRQIADQLRGLIERGEYLVGARLPPERDLARALGVSRPSVREALIALEVEGRVEVRMGSGIYVLPVTATNLQRVCAESPLETLRARQSIESELAAHAAAHMKKGQVAGLRNALALMRQEVEAGHTPADGDRLFHVRVAQASDNPVLTRIVTDLFDERHNPLFEHFGSHFETARAWSAAIDEHAAVVEAIASGVPGAARAAMAQHLANSFERFTASITAGASSAVATTKTVSKTAPTTAPKTARKRTVKPRAKPRLL